MTAHDASERRARSTAYAGLVLATLFWAGNAVLARGVADQLPPFSLAFWRWAGALLVLLPFGLPHVVSALPEIRAKAGRLICLGLFGVAGYNTLLYIAAHSTTALNITLVNSTTPLVIALLARVILGHRTTRQQVAAFVLAGVGMLVIVGRGEWQVIAELAFRKGDLIMVGAVLVWAIYSVLLRLWPMDLHPLGFLTVTIGVGVVALLPLFLTEVARRGHFAWNPGTLAIFGYLAVLPSLLSYSFWNRGVAVLGPNATGIFIYLVPVFTAVLGYLIIGERLEPYHLAGGACILLGLVLATRGYKVEPPG